MKYYKRTTESGYRYFNEYNSEGQLISYIDLNRFKYEETDPEYQSIGRHYSSSVLFCEISSKLFYKMKALCTE